MRPTEHELGEFANALQLCIKTEIKDVAISGDALVIELDEPGDDENLRRFTSLVDAQWEEGRTRCLVRAIDVIDWPRLTLFLLLTRLEDKNIPKFAQLDPSAREFAEKLGFGPAVEHLDSVRECSRSVFAKMKKRGMTIRELAEATGLTQVSISNFKAGKDIKLSNFVKIVRALDVNLKLE